jgi:hypothetical protein
MKYMNHLRKLALLSSLALSFSVAVQADGTLPLPFDSKAENLPLELAADNSNVKLTISRMGYVPAPGLKPCEKTEDFYTLAGTLETDDGNKLQVKGICTPQNLSGVDTLTRTVVAENVVPSAPYLLLKGRLGVKEILNPASGEMVPSIKSFTGILSPSSGAGPEAGSTVTLYRTR